MTESSTREELGARLRTLLNATSAFSRARSVPELLEQLAVHAVALTNAERSSIFLAEPGENALLSRVALDEEHSLRIAIGQGIAGHVHRTGEPLVVPDAYADPRFSPETDGKTGYKTRNLLCVPMRHLSRPPLGVLEVLNCRSGLFDIADVELLLGLAAHAAAALEEVQSRTERDAFVASLLDAHRTLEVRVAQLGMLHEIEMALSRDEGLDEILHTVLSNLALVFDVEAGGFLDSAERGETLYFLVAWGPEAKKLQNVQLEKGEGIASWCFHAGETVLANDPASDPRFSPRIGKMIGFETRNLLCVPITVEGRRLGALELCNRRHGDFTQEDSQAAELLARNIGSVLVRREARQQRQRQAALESLGTFAQGIAHDLRAPLANLLTACVRLGEPGFNIHQVSGLPSLMERQVRRCLSMTSDILDYSRDSIAYTFEPLDASAVIEDLRENVGHEIAERRIALAVHVEPGCAIEADRARLARVFANIVLNSLRALGSRGSIRVECRRAGSEIWFAFEDDGPGVPEQLRDTIFEPFTSGAQSTGLGLAIARRIVQGHGGRLWLDATHAPGARFVIALPGKLDA